MSSVTSRTDDVTVALITFRQQLWDRGLLWRVVYDRPIDPIGGPRCRVLNHNADPMFADIRYNAGRLDQSNRDKSAMRFLVVLLAVFFTTPVAAQEETGKIGGWPSEFEGRQPVGMPPGEGWKVVSGDGALLTSDCVGVLTSPECLIDTMITCTARSWVGPEQGFDYNAAHPTVGPDLFFNPICNVPRSDGRDEDPWIIAAGPGVYHPEDFVFYYKTEPFVWTEAYLMLKRFIPPTPEGWSCEGCPSDVTIAFPSIRCSPDPALIGVESYRKVFKDFPDDSPYSYCIEWITNYAVVARWNNQDGRWFIVHSFRPDLIDPMHGGWLYL